MSQEVALPPLLGATDMTSELQGYHNVIKQFILSFIYICYIYSNSVIFSVKLNLGQKSKPFMDTLHGVHNPLSISFHLHLKLCRNQSDHVPFFLITLMRHRGLILHLYLLYRL